MKTMRQGRIVEILRTQAVSSQAELASLLARAGQRVTQATLSRDLDELGAFKARTADGRIAYHLPDEAPNGPPLQRVITEFVTGVAASGNLVVLRTPPGCAQPVARAVDTDEVDGVLATVAGDDTVLVVCTEGASSKRVAKNFEVLAGLTRSKGA